MPVTLTSAKQHASFEGQKSIQIKVVNSTRYKFLLVPSREKDITIRDTDIIYIQWAQTSLGSPYLTSS